MSDYHSTAKEPLETILSKPMGKASYDEPRSLSVNQFEALFTHFQVKSKLMADFETEKSKSEVNEVRISDLEAKRRSMAREIEEKVKELHDKIQAENEFISTVKRDNENRYKSSQSLIKINADKIKKLDTFAEDTKIVEDSIMRWALVALLVWF